MFYLDKAKYLVEGVFFIYVGISWGKVKWRVSVFFFLLFIYCYYV